MSRSIAFILSNESDVTDLLADGANSVTTLFTEQQDNLPYIVIIEEDVEPTDDYSESSEKDEVTFTVYAYAAQEYDGASGKGSRDIIDQVRSTLEAASAGTYNTEVISDIRKLGGVSADYVNWGKGNLIEAQQTFTMWRDVTAGATDSVPAILLTQAEFNAIGTPDGNTYYLDEDTVEPGEFTIELDACADATVENSDQSYQTTVASGDTLVLPNIGVTINETHSHGVGAVLAGSSVGNPSVKNLTVEVSSTRGPVYWLNQTTYDGLTPNANETYIIDDDLANDVIQTNFDAWPA